MANGLIQPVPAQDRLLNQNKAELLDVTAS